MRIRALVIVVTLVAGSAATASATPARPRPAPTPVATGRPAPLGFQRDDFRSEATLRAAALRVFEEHAAAAHAAAATGGAQQPVWAFGDSDAALPDIDGDGVGDVLSARAFARQHNIAVLSGRTGRSLWSASLNLGFGGVYVPAPAGKSVVLTFSRSATGAGTGGVLVDVDSTTVDALNPKTGAVVWSTSVGGPVTYTPVGVPERTVGEFDGVLLRKNATPYLLFDRLSIVNVDTGSYAIWSTPEVIDATTGTVVASGPPVEGKSINYLRPIGDLDGDGVDDYLGLADGNGMTVSARSGSTGLPLWTTEDKSIVAFTSVAPSPDLTGDGKTDVLLGWLDHSGAGIHARSGATGAAVWSVRGNWAVPIGDIDHDGRSDTRVVNDGVSPALEAISGTGKRLWSHVAAAPSHTIGELWETGDLDGDHIADAYVQFSPTKRGGWPEWGDIVNGRTGASRRVADLGWPMGVSLRGRAPSFVRGIPDEKGCWITAYDGRSHRAFWHVLVRTSDEQEVQTLDVLDLGHGRSGLLVLLSGATTDTVVLLDGARGTTLWKTTYELHQ